MDTVLIIEDNAITRRSLRCLLEEQDEWNVAEACNGQDGLEKAVALCPDVIVLDFMMPDMNGLEAAACIKRINPRTPLILLTGYKSDSLERYAYEAGFSGVIEKGASARHLVQLVQILVKYGKSSTLIQQPALEKDTATCS